MNGDWQFTYDSESDYAYFRDGLPRPLCYNYIGEGVYAGFDVETGEVHCIMVEHWRHFLSGKWISREVVGPDEWLRRLEARP